MKTIGLIGGMSWQSSIEYYKLLNQYTAKYLGDSHSSKVILNSLDFNEIAEASHKEDWETIAQLVKNAAINLEKAGADIILLATNTIHLVSNTIESSISIPFLHIAEATGKEIQKKGLKKVGLLGTQFTMEKDFYTGYISKHFNIEVVIPKKEDRKVLHTIIYDELVKGVFTDASKEIIKQMIQNMKSQNIEGIILGCTELPILIPEKELDIPSFDTTKIHVLEALDWALEPQKIT